MYADDEARKRSDTIYIVWTRQLRQWSMENSAATLAATHRGDGDIPIKAVLFKDGAFNRCYRITFARGPDAIVRLPIMGRVILRREKVESEISVMEYISQHSSIPIPRVIGSGVCGVGPYMVMEFVDGSSLGECLGAPLTDDTKVAILNPEIDLAELRRGYRAMAKVVLALSRCQFARIGCPTRDADGIWSVGKRPVMTFNINDLLVHANFPPQEIRQGPFSTATDYFIALAEDHMRHLKTQRNDAVDDEMDCKRKYVARCLFKKIASTFSTAYNDGPFPLFCDDLRPSNVIVDSDLRLQGVVDWEFCYAAPVEFTYCSPWWLLLAHPDNWEDGFDDFLSHYMPRQQIFLSVLRDCENEAAAQGDSHISLPLSELMERSMQDGTFWFCLAARSSFAFDDIYWKFIDARYYGEFTSIEDRIALLSVDEQTELGGFYQMKMEQEAEGKLDEHQTVDELCVS